MKVKTLLLGAAASIALTLPAQAGNDWYLGVEGGISSISDVDAVVDIFVPPTLVTTTSGTISTDTGWALLATLGWHLDSNWRIEAEVGYRDNTTDLDYNEVTEWSLMANALYDIPVSEDMVFSLGAGLGYDMATLDVLGIIDDQDSNFAYQGILGLSVAISPTMDLTATYRYLRVSSPSFTYAEGGDSVSVDLDDVSKHAFTVGLRFNMDQPE